jgi:hypothetical protein
MIVTGHLAVDSDGGVVSAAIGWVLLVLRRGTMRRWAALMVGLLAGATAFAQSSQLAIGASTIQRVISSQLFSTQGRWYLSDNGPCYSFLESPQVRVANGRVYLDAHLSSRIGARLGGNCLGAGFASNVTLSGRLIGHGSTLTLDDVRIESVADGATADVLGLIDQTAPQALPHALSVDVLAVARGQSIAAEGIPISVNNFQITDVATVASAVVVRFVLSLSAP